ncbi:MAG TPA: ComEC/Rec2 family competence protein [Thermomicrobiales bacterium]|nr:ComEC/Rec2 family competence protein [Thermomicrobiales bacterium]
MTRPWLLIIASGITIGALFGLAGALVFALVATLSVALAGQRVQVLGCVVLVAALCGAVRGGSSAERVVGPEVLSSSRAEGVVASQPQSGPSGPRAVIEVDRVTIGNGDWIDAAGRVLVFFRETVPTGIGHGDRIRVVWAVTAVEDFDPDFRRFVASGDAGASAWSFDTTVLEHGATSTNILIRVRDTVTARLESAIAGDAGALIAGFVTGDDSGLSDGAREAFERTNTSHVTAVSGSNVAVLLSMLLVLAPTRRMQRSLPMLLGAVVLIWSYVILVGMGPGALRAGIFATFMLPAARLGRRADPLTALMTASAIMVLIRPSYSHSVGFWLSMAASAAMVTTLSLSRPGSTLSVMRRAVVALVAAQVATLPITFWVFDGWSPGSVVANLIIGPLVSFVFPFAFVTALLVTVLPWAGPVVGWIPGLGADAIIAVVKSVAGAMPILRAGTLGSGGLGLIVAFAVAILGLLSVDVRRWVMRVEFRREHWVPFTPPMLLGASVGVWLVMIALAVWR